MKLSKNNKIYVPNSEYLMYNNPCYESKVFERVVPFIKSRNRNVAIDIGAHIGLWSVRLANFFDKVICFEPVLEHQECHMKNCENFKNIILHRVGLSEKEEKLPFHISKGNSGASKIVKENSKNKDTYIEVKKLDSYNLNKVDFIKIDAENHEEKIILGGLETIKINTPIIHMEIHENSSTKTNTINILKEIGYKIEYKNWHNYLFIKR